jgi:hypothetical protein
MNYRKLRIMWSVWWGMVAVLLCVLWLKSYSRVKMLDVSEYRFVAHHGKVVLGTSAGAADANTDYYNVDFYDELRNPQSWFINVNRPIKLRLWLIATVCTAMTALPWIRYRFSLRTLLIATTLIALGLGAVVWLSR